MLFFYGIRTSIIGRYLLHGLACVYCGTLESVFVTVYSRYLHVFWIPLVPLGKSSVSQCAHCQQLIKPAQMPPSYRMPALNLEKHARTPVSNYIVLALVGVAFLVLMVVGKLSSTGKNRPDKLAATPAATYSGTTDPDPDTEAASDATEALLADPRVGDFYALYNPDHHYSVLRVARVVPDTLYFQGCVYRPEHLRDVALHPDSLLKTQSPMRIPMPRTNVRTWKEAKILSVIRN